MSDEFPPDSPEDGPKRPHFLDYPSPPRDLNADAETGWDLCFAMLKILGIMAVGGFIVFGICGGLFRGCR